MEFLSFFEHSPELLAVTDREGVILNVNPAWQKATEFQRHELINLSIPGSLPGSASAFKGSATLQGKGVLNFPDSTSIRLEWTVFPIDDSNRGFSAKILPDEFSEREAELAQLYRAIIDHADLSIIATDTHGVIQTFNSTASKLLGYSPEEVIGNRVPGIVHDWSEIEAHAEKLSQELGRKIKPGFETLIVKARDLGIPDENEWTYIRKNGQTFPVALTVTALRDGLGRITGYIGVGRDISVLRKVEERLSEARRKTDQFLEALPIGVYVVDHAGKPQYANLRCKQILGNMNIPRAETILDSQQEAMNTLFISGTDIPYPHEKMPSVVGLHGIESHISDMVVRVNGTETPLEVWGKPVFDHRGKVAYSIAAIVDISEQVKNRKRLLEALKTQKQLNEELNSFTINLKKLHETLTQEYENVDVQFLEILKTGTELLNLPFASFGRVIEKTYLPMATLYPEGFPTIKGEQRLNDTYCEFVMERENTVTYQEFGKEMAGIAHPAYTKYKIEAFIGTPVWVHGRIYGTLSFSSAAPKLDGFNRQEKELLELMSQAIGFAIEAEESRSVLQEASEELRNSNEELMRINLELDQFAYVVSHDLKAPLRAINNISTWLEEDLGEKLDNDSRNHLSLLRNRVARMDSMINGILAYSRAGRKKGNLMPIDLNLLLPEIIEILEVPPTFTLDIQEGMPTLFGDKTELLQAFTNLIGNAIKYHNQPDGKISITFKKRGKFYFISVSDDGPGIPQEFHERIFGVFQRLEGRDEIEGTGVGLSIVRKIIESNGGKIKVKSKPGEGANFIFSWPVHQDSIA